ncbi:hypothetical protein C5467_12370 [Photorhabdus khanii subsp. guanajuatensis]|uniref:Uncharacterized protein n=1 Tax=Photorhabdus khanii subsp. guanajuatensis TaxID=2100166 RepID=A0A4R4JQW5_9GAMM|nr:hypothetical protein C5467_12370 [Photorhabdus khanii subsp. guanajuatensis]
MSMLVGVFELNNIKFFSCLYLVLVNIAGCPKNRIKERSSGFFCILNQYHTWLIIIPVTLFYYY